MSLSDFSQSNINQTAMSIINSDPKLSNAGKALVENFRKRFPELSDAQVVETFKYFSMIVGGLGTRNDYDFGEISANDILTKVGVIFAASAFIANNS